MKVWWYKSKYEGFRFNFADGLNEECKRWEPSKDLSEALVEMQTWGLQSKLSSYRLLGISPFSSLFSLHNTYHMYLSCSPPTIEKFLDKRNCSLVHARLAQARLLT